jgi:hypothetical protein
LIGCRCMLSSVVLMCEVFGSGPYGTLQEDCATSNGNVVGGGYVGMYEQAWDGVMWGKVNTLSPLFLVIGANNTHSCIDLMMPTFTHLNDIGNLT